ncbi:hypothetical protein ACG2F4_05875 [Halalkalibaculum sp. DA3122]|uniref:hypothetical protein n=1 Tax=unclassified Halalkalibaculum TaxID=2964617 RepID=UPI003753F6C2
MNQQNSQEQKKEPKPLVVITTVASFGDKNRGITHRLQPIRILEENGRKHRVQSVRACHEEPVGHGHKQVHVTLVTEEERYMNIVFDTRKIGWFLLSSRDEMILDGGG